MAAHLEEDVQNAYYIARQVKRSGSLNLRIEDFEIWYEFQQNKSFEYRSKSMELKFQDLQLKFRLGINFFTKADEFLDFFIVSENSQELNIGFDFFVQDKTGAYVHQQKGAKRFSETDNAWGFRAFAKSAIINNYLFQGHLVSRCDVTIYRSDCSTFNSQNPGSEIEICTKLEMDKTKLEMDKTKLEIQSSSNFEDELQTIWRDFADFTIVCDGQDIPCHSIVLARQSDVFKTLLLDEKPEERRAIIEGCSSLAMFGLLEFLYTNTLQNKDGYNSKELMSLAYRYNVKSLTTKCEKALARSVNCSNAIDLLAAASEVKSKYLLSIVSKFVLFHQQELCDSEMWKAKVLQTSEVIGDYLNYSNQ